MNLFWRVDCKKIHIFYGIMLLLVWRLTFNLLVLVTWLVVAWSCIHIYVKFFGDTATALCGCDTVKFFLDAFVFNITFFGCWEKSCICQAWKFWEPWINFEGERFIWNYRFDVLSLIGFFCLLFECMAKLGCTRSKLHELAS